MTPIGQAPQLQPNLIQTAVQQDSSQRQVQQQAQQARSETTSRASAETQNFQKLAEEVLAKRASGESVQRPAVERGQVLDMLV